MKQSFILISLLLSPLGVLRAEEDIVIADFESGTYLDGDKVPALTFTEFSLLKGDLKVGAPLAQAHPGGLGNNLYLPIPYAKHCKVTWEVGKEGARYYQINYRTYAAGTNVKTFALPQVQASKGLIDRVNQTLESPVPSAAGKVSSLSKQLAAGGEASLDLPAGAGAIRNLELRLETDDVTERERTLRSIIVKLAFDGEVTVWCPATDFFGSGVGINELHSWYRNVSSDGIMRCRSVMPYQKSATLTLLNVGTMPVMAALQATTSPWTWDHRSMYFHAAWHHEAGLKTPPHRDWNFITIAGCGVYAGDSLALFNSVATWYGEGDEKIWVDGESFPSHLGTGTEDYYNYWYAFPGATSNVVPQSKDAAAPVPTLAQAQADGQAVNPRRPGALECENLKMVRKSEGLNISTQEMEGFGAGVWSAGNQLLARAGKVGDFVELEIPASGSAPKQLTLYLTQANDYATLGFCVNGQPCPTAFDGFASKVQLAPGVQLGVFTPQDAHWTIRAEVTGSNPLARGAKFFFGLDCVVLEPAP